MEFASSRITHSRTLILSLWIALCFDGIALVEYIAKVTKAFVALLTYIYFLILHRFSRITAKQYIFE